MLSLQSWRTALLWQSTSMLNSLMALRSCCRIIIMGLERSLMSGSGRRCALSKVQSLSTDLRFLRRISCLIAKKSAVRRVASMKSRNGGWAWNHVTILSSARHDLLVRSHHCGRPGLVHVTRSLSTLCGGRVGVLGSGLRMVDGVYLNMVFFTNSCHAACSWEILSHCYWSIFVGLVAEQLLSAAVSIIVAYAHVLAGLVSVETSGMHASVMIMSDLICLKVGVAFLVKATVNVWSLLSPLELHWSSVDHAGSLARVV